MVDSADERHLRSQRNAEFVVGDAQGLPFPCNTTNSTANNTKPTARSDTSTTPRDRAEGDRSRRHERRGRRCHRTRLGIFVIDTSDATAASNWTFAGQPACETSPRARRSSLATSRRRQGTGSPRPARTPAALQIKDDERTHRPGCYVVTWSTTSDLSEDRGISRTPHHSFSAGSRSRRPPSCDCRMSLPGMSWNEMARRDRSAVLRRRHGLHEAWSTTGSTGTCALAHLRQRRIE